MQVARQNSFVLFNEMKAFHLNVEFLSLHILSCAIVQWMQYCNYFKTYLLNKMPSPEKLFIIQCNPFSLAGCVTSKKFRCQHNKENLRLVSAHILWGARPDSESIQGVPEKMLSCLKFCVRVALFKLDCLRDKCAESWSSWAQMKNVKLRILKLPLLPLLLNKSYTDFKGAFFLGHPVYLDQWRSGEASRH